MTNDQAAVFVLALLLWHYFAIRGWKERAEAAEEAQDSAISELAKYMERARHLALKARRRGKELRRRDEANRRSREQRREIVGRTTQEQEELRVAEGLRQLAGTACDLPPAGWKCTRDPGHTGPCACIPIRRTRVAPLLLCRLPEARA